MGNKMNIAEQIQQFEQKRITAQTGMDALITKGITLAGEGRGHLSGARIRTRRNRQAPCPAEECRGPPSEQSDACWHFVGSCYRQRPEGHRLSAIHEVYGPGPWQPHASA